MNGRWRVEPRGAARAGKPWLVLRGAEHEAVLWNGAVLELVGARGAPRSARTSSASRPTSRRCSRACAAGRRSVRSVTRCSTSGSWPGSGISGRPRRSGRPASRRGGGSTEVDDSELRAVLEAAHTLMRESVDGGRPPRRVYRRAGRVCPRCGGVIRSAPQGENARTAYWCPGCQVGGNAPPS